MKAIIITKNGSLDSLQMQDLPIPEILPNQVLVKVKACGINPVDWKQYCMAALNYHILPEPILPE